MRKYKKIFINCMVAGALVVSTMTGCGAASKSAGEETAESADETSKQDNVAAAQSVSSAVNSVADQKISIVCTNFPEYDFVRQIVGTHADVTMLLKPGAESHTFEPTPQDIITIQNSNLFVYVGGDSDEWVSGVLDSMDQSKMTIVKLMDCVDTVAEQLVEGMQPEKAGSEDTAAQGSTQAPEMDEHVWTSPANAMQIVQALSDKICGLDPANRDIYQANTQAYLQKLKKLDQDFWDVVNHSKRKEIVVGDRFPFRYFCKEYGLKYYAAFPGCSADTEPDAATVAFLIDKVKADKIPVVFHIELSNEQMCNSITEATGAKSELLNAVHNVSDSDFKAGATYVSLMEHNVQVLKEALN